MKLSQLNEAFERLTEAEDRNVNNAFKQRYSNLSELKNNIAKSIAETKLNNFQALTLSQDLIMVVVRLYRELSNLSEVDRKTAAKKLKYIDHYINGANKSLQTGKLALDESLMDREFSLNESKEYKDLADDFNIDDLENEFAKRVSKFKELINNRDEVDNHYINRFNYDLAILKKMLEEEINDLDTSDVDEVKDFYNDVDFRIKHAEDYVGLPG